MCAGTSRTLTTQELIQAVVNPTAPGVSLMNVIALVLNLYTLFLLLIPFIFFKAKFIRAFLERNSDAYWWALIITFVPFGEWFYYSKVLSKVEKVQAKKVVSLLLFWFVLLLGAIFLKVILTDTLCIDVPLENTISI